MSRCWPCDAATTTNDVERVIGPVGRSKAMLIPFTRRPFGEPSTT
jgi:hypothetical protein